MGDHSKGPRDWRPSDRQISRVIADLMHEYHRALPQRCQGDCESTFGAGCTMADARALLTRLNTGETGGGR